MNLYDVSPIYFELVNIDISFILKSGCYVYYLHTVHLFHYCNIPNSMTHLVVLHSRVWVYHHPIQFNQHCYLPHHPTRRQLHWPQLRLIIWTVLRWLRLLLIRGRGKQIMKRWRLSWLDNKWLKWRMLSLLDTLYLSLKYFNNLWLVSLPDFTCLLEIWFLLTLQSQPITKQCMIVYLLRSTPFICLE